MVVERGRGIGRQALGLILEYAFERLAAQRVWLDVMIENARARRAYAAVGFIPERGRREAVRTPDGTRSLAVMSLSRSQWTRAALTTCLS